MGKRIMLGVIVFFLLVLSMVILKSKTVWENHYLQSQRMKLEEMRKGGMMTGGNKMMAQSSLSGATWVWTMTSAEGAKDVKPKQADKFTLMFGADGRVSGTTDCNTFAGSYKVMCDKVMFGELMGTKKFCDASQEEVFTKAVVGADSYKIEEDGTLVLMMKDDAGMVYFSPAKAVEAEPVM